MNRLAESFPLPQYYADPHQMMAAIRAKSTFNIIDVLKVDKVDLFMLSMDLRYQTAFETKVRRPVAEAEQIPLEIWVARLEDVIVGKLIAWAESRSYRHLADIYEMMVFHYLQQPLGETATCTLGQVQTVKRVS